MGSGMDDSKDRVRFHLTTRPSDDGRAVILLRLYRGGQLASETVISTIKETKARMILLMSRMQLFRLGYEEHVPATPQVTDFQFKAA